MSTLIAFHLKREPTEAELIGYVRQVLENSDDLRRKPWKGSADLVAGHCYVVAEALFYLLNDGAEKWKPMFVNHEGAPHWFLKSRSTDRILDPTATQFQTPVNYKAARGKGFLTKNPSKRARVMMDRVISAAKTNTPPRHRGGL